MGERERARKRPLIYTSTGKLGRILSMEMIWPDLCLKHRLTEVRRVHGDGQKQHEETQTTCHSYGDK